MTPAADPVTTFFDNLSSLEPDPSLRKVSGTIRFDLTGGKQTERWLLTIRRGDLTVSHRNVAADTVIRLSRALFERLASGATNIFPALLRGEIALEGDYRLIIVLRRLLRKRMAARQPQRAAGYATRQR